MELKKLFAEQQWTHKRREQNYGHRERGEGEMYGESNMETHITIYKVNSQWECAVCLREHKQVLCINLVGWGGGGRREEGSRGGDICIPMIDSFRGLTEGNKILQDNYPSIKK